MPERLEGLAKPEPFWLLRLEPFKRGQDLGFQFSWRKIATGESGLETQLEIPAGPPPEAFRLLHLALPKPLRSPDDHLLPATPLGLWTYVKAAAFQALGLECHPCNPLLLTGVVYTGRLSGQLVVARRAAERRDLMSFPDHQSQVVDLLWLYLGDYDRFELSIQELPGHLRTVVQRFYRGYLLLLKGERSRARESFAAAEAVTGGYSHYLRQVQDHPRWKALLRNVQERQRLMEANEVLAKFP